LRISTFRNVGPLARPEGGRSWYPAASEPAQVLQALADDPGVCGGSAYAHSARLLDKVYASAVRRRERLIGAALREFDAALEWVVMSSGEPD
jgi:hypothetical protein